MITLDLPLPPALSRLYRNKEAGKGRADTARYKTWKAAAQYEALLHRRSVGAQHIPGRV